VSVTGYVRRAHPAVAPRPARGYVVRPMGDVDLALRNVATHCPEELVQVLAEPGEVVRSLRWIDTQLALRERRADKGIVAQHDGYRVIYHHEWFMDDEEDIAWRMFEYACELVAATRATDEALHHAAVKAAKKHPARPPPPRPDPVYVRACAVLLDGPARPVSPEGRWRITPPGTPPAREGRHTFRVEAVYQQTTAQLLAHPGALWTVFAPLAVDATEDNLRLAVQAARERAHSPRQLEGIATAMEALATARPRFDQITDRINAMFKDEGIIERTPSYRQGVEKGIEKGIEEGIEKGAAAFRSVLLATLRARSLRVSAAQRARIAATHDLATLAAWTQAAALAKTTAEALSAPPT